VVKSFPSLKIRYILNPRSGRALHARVAVERFAAARGESVAATTGPRHATALAQAAIADGCDAVVAVGGDGTMNEVATALVGTGTALGLVPCGSGNGLARHLGCYGSVAHALAVIAAGRTRRIDTGLAAGNPFFCAAGLGFEAEVADRFNRLTSRGFLRYLTTSLRAFREFQPLACTLTYADGTTSLAAFTVAVANTDQYGNNARIAPGARCDDGRINLTAVPPLHALNLLPLAVQLFAGTLGRNPRVARFEGTAFTVCTGKPGRLHTDGEVHDVGPEIEFRVRPASLLVLAPPEV
jgi:diacylglycerol kinase (ATP)